MQLTQWEQVHMEAHLFERSCQMNFLIDHDPNGVDLWRDEKACIEALLARVKAAEIVEGH